MKPKIPDELIDVYEKVIVGERLSAGDGMRLYETSDLNAVGYMANFVRERLCGNVAWYVRNQHINYTNICNKLCRFCSFYVPPKDIRGYVLSPEDVRERVRQYLHIPITEIHMVAGINPRLPYSYYIDIVRAVKDVRPEVAVKAFTAIEWVQIARIAKKTAPGGDGGAQGCRACRQSPAAARKSSAIGSRRRCSGPRPTPTNGCGLPAPRTTWACPPTPRCSTATSRIRTNGFSTWSAFERASG